MKTSVKITVGTKNGSAFPGRVGYGGSGKDITIARVLTASRFGGVTDDLPPTAFRGSLRGAFGNRVKSVRESTPFLQESSLEIYYVRSSSSSCTP